MACHRIPVYIESGDDYYNLLMLVPLTHIPKSCQVLAIRRTMQINSRPIEIIIYFWKQSGNLHRDEID